MGKRRVARGHDIAAAIAEFCASERACSIFAVSGGGNGPLYSAFADSAVPLIHCRCEEACAYAAIEASLASECPAVVCVTTGEAIAKALSAMPSARAEGARVLVCSAYSDPGQFGRASIQSTDAETMPGDFYRAGPLFDFARVLVSAEELPWVMNRLAVGFQSPRGFVAHIALPRTLQEARWVGPPRPTLRVLPPGPAPCALDYCAEALSRESFAVVVGYGARQRGAALRNLLRLTGAEVFTTPRAKGVVSAPCIGLGAAPIRYSKGRPERLLVLGSRLGQASCGWDEALLPRKEIIHVDLEPSCFGAAYSFPTYGVQAEIGIFLDTILVELESRLSRRELLLEGA